MGCVIGDLVRLRRTSTLVDLRGRVGTNIGKVGDVWAGHHGELVTVVYEDEQVLALDVPATEFIVERPIAAAV